MWPGRHNHHNRLHRLMCETLGAQVILLQIAVLIGLLSNIWALLLGSVFTGATYSLLLLAGNSWKKLFSISSLDNTCKYKANTLRFTDCDLAKLGSFLCSKNLSFESFWWTLWCFFLFFFSPEVLQEAVMGLYAMPLPCRWCFWRLGGLDYWTVGINHSQSWEW